ncbi:pre-mRNA splicing regulator USH1G [Ictalurus punctatus]|uniref:Pre-mRNA splicing regulator USH1G n=1 Tax=Ictalurus punctatus TaxID=7998 RepID=A0A9F7RDZ4_ICTPU|nr:pre-mRNA splicing regulator USH1G [Ictalurus punctatus]XP_053541240.1 pre-mRNA splicing regulator USH1G [Ictalurus punctatus]XP_053541241.1 pre-mRNA splicing regulator USH1G [Ictalurus punctatus]XP_053541242.1 pre-mRNA splicing regulator USH1G [Ictalurus punctatus]XP_053541243.1 pre-mRNA splicing regulator USH1G [Ictalurus punctatus]XP_053541244.1 pre-mRNA splicing regulator USH1G [Ictalurus punctatus]
MSVHPFSATLRVPTWRSGTPASAKHLLQVPSSVAGPIYSPREERCCELSPTAARGEPDKCDIWGNTPLHLAAANGHLDCLSFLVSFGANVWCLDNDYHTPLDMAAMRGHMDTVRYLDSVAAKQSTLNPKLVRKLKERAFHNAEQRIKHCAELQHENQRRMEKKFLKETVDSGASGSVRFSVSYGRKIPQFNTVNSSISYTQATLNSKGRTKFPKCLKKKQADDTFKISEDGRKSVRSLSGLQLGNDVMFLKQQTYANPRHRLHVRNMFPQNPNDLCDDDEDDDVAVVSHAVSDPGLYNDPGQRSLFSRPGLGTLVFRRNYGSDGVQEDDSYSVEGQVSSWREQNIHFREGICLGRPSLDQDTISNRLLKAFLWDCDDGNDDDDDDEVEYDGLQHCSSPLEVFLVSQGLGEFLFLFVKEQMDLEALMLCSEPNLCIINVPLGPRKKLLEACSRRRHTLQRARAMCDTQL